VEPGSLFLSTITLHELELGVLLMERRDAQQGSLLLQRLEQAVLPAFSATALEHKLVVVTRNLANFEATGVRVANPWQQR